MTLEPVKSTYILNTPLIFYIWSIWGWGRYLFIYLNDVGKETLATPMYSSLILLKYAKKNQLIGQKNGSDGKMCIIFQMCMAIK